jgi:hypothetical protein
MEQAQLLAHNGSSKITREELKMIPAPPGSPTYQPIPHYGIVGALAETLPARKWESAPSNLRERRPISLRFSASRRQALPTASDGE